MACSVIIPCCNEYPQVLFTVQSVLEGGADEVIVVSNKSTDKTNEYFGNLRNKKVKFFIKDDKLSHWQAKNLGIQESSGDLLFFVDSHCIIGADTLGHLASFIKDGKDIAHCVIHYMLDNRPLIYVPRFELFNYRFSGFPPTTVPFKVPVMSTCGMMCPRKVMDEIGGWNTELGIYGGGEAYINWKHGTCGYNHYVHPLARCWHYAEKRGYSWNYDDFMRNEFIAAYCVGGEEWLDRMIDSRKKKPSARIEDIDAVALDVITKCKADRDFIKSKQIMTYDEFVLKEKGNG